MVANTFIKVFLEGYPAFWQTGRELMGARVTLGQNERSSSCEVTLADPSGDLAADLIWHSLLSGGIQPLPAPAVPPGNTANSAGASGIAVNPTGQMPANREAWEQAVVAECLRQGVADRSQIAYILATAFHESDRFQTLEEYASGEDYEGREDLGNTHPGDGVRFKGK